MSRLVAFFVALALNAAVVLANPSVWRSEWPQTDFSRTTIKEWSEILSGGPPKDGIPAIDAPKFLRVQSERDIAGNEPVMTLEIEGQPPRAYPIRYLMWHEIVNDEVGGIPVAVTYCPLCNSAMTFDRRVQGRVLSFGVSGKLRNSDMVMYDRETESWWQQAIGEGIVGEMTGVRLETLPGWMESWDQFRSRNPEGLVMAEPDFDRSYGRNPYHGYDTSPRPFYYYGDDPPHGIPPLERVVRVGDRTWPITRIRSEGGVNEAGVRITWEAGQASALEAVTIAGGRDVGTVRVRDRQGRDVAHDVLFAFAFHAFWPDGEWMLP